MGARSGALWLRVAALLTLFTASAIAYGGATGKTGATGEHGGANGEGRSPLAADRAAWLRVNGNGMLPTAVTGGGGGNCHTGSDGGGGSGGDGCGGDGDGGGKAPAAAFLDSGILTGVPSPFGCVWTWPTNCRPLDPNWATCKLSPLRAEGMCVASALR